MRPIVRLIWFAAGIILAWTALTGRMSWFWGGLGIVVISVLTLFSLALRRFHQSGRTLLRHDAHSGGNSRIS